MSPGGAAAHPAADPYTAPSYIRPGLPATREFGNSAVVSAIDATYESLSSQTRAGIPGRQPSPLRWIDRSGSRPAGLLIEQRHAPVLPGQDRVFADRALHRRASRPAIKARIRPYRAGKPVSAPSGCPCAPRAFTLNLGWRRSRARPGAARGFSNLSRLPLRESRCFLFSARGRRIGRRSSGIPRRVSRLLCLHPGRVDPGTFALGKHIRSGRPKRDRDCESKGRKGPALRRKHADPPWKDQRGWAA